MSCLKTSAPPLNIWHTWVALLLWHVWVVSACPQKVAKRHRVGAASHIAPSPTIHQECTSTSKAPKKSCKGMNTWGTHAPCRLRLTSHEWVQVQWVREGGYKKQFTYSLHAGSGVARGRPCFAGATFHCDMKKPAAAWLDPEDNILENAADRCVCAQHANAGFPDIPSNNH